MFRVLYKTRDIIKDTFRGDVGTKLAINVANGVRLQHSNAYNDITQQARAHPPSQYSSASSFLLRGAR
jgi:hypothetical protein